MLGTSGRAAARRGDAGARAYYSGFILARCLGVGRGPCGSDHSQQSRSDTAGGALGRGGWGALGRPAARRRLWGWARAADRLGPGVSRKPGGRDRAAPHRSSRSEEARRRTPRTPHTTHTQATPPPTLVSRVHRLPTPPPAPRRSGGRAAAPRHRDPGARRHAGAPPAGQRARGARSGSRTGAHSGARAARRAPAPPHAPRGACDERRWPRGRRWNTGAPLAANACRFAIIAALPGRAEAARHRRGAGSPPAYGILTPLSPPVPPQQQRAGRANATWFVAAERPMGYLEAG